MSIHPHMLQLFITPDVHRIALTRPFPVRLCPDSPSNYSDIPLCPLKVDLRIVLEFPQRGEAGELGTSGLVRFAEESEPGE